LIVRIYLDGITTTECQQDKQTVTDAKELVAVAATIKSLYLML
jgi:hypothetical protein